MYAWKITALHLLQKKWKHSLFVQCSVIPPHLSFWLVSQFPHLEWTAAGWGWDSPYGCPEPVYWEKKKKEKKRKRRMRRDEVGKSEVKSVNISSFLWGLQYPLTSDSFALSQHTWSSPVCTVLCSSRSGRRRSRLWGRACATESACSSVSQNHNATGFPLKTNK